MAPTETTPLAESSAKAVTKAGVNATAAGSKGAYGSVGDGKDIKCCRGIRRD